MHHDAPYRVGTLAVNCVEHEYNSHSGPVGIYAFSFMFDLSFSFDLMRPIPLRPPITNDIIHHIANENGK